MFENLSSKMGKCSAGIGALICALVCLPRHAGSAEEEARLIRADYPAMLSRSDLVYEQPAAKPVEGHPIGNGRMGTMVWTTPETVEFQINRSDVFAVNREHAGNQHGPTDYCGGCARISVDVGGQVFTDGSGFSQHLSLYDAEDVIETDEVTARCFVSSNDVLVLEIDDRRSDPQPLRVDVSMWRAPTVVHGAHKAAYEFQTEPETVLLSQQFTDTDYYNGSSVVVRAAGASGVVQTPNSGRITIPAAKGKRLIQIASAASWDPSINLSTAAKANLAANAGKPYEALRNDHVTPWHDLWSRTFINLSSADGRARQAERIRNLQLYYMASSSRGALPPKWNGSIFAVEGDTRRWGSQFWVWTTESSYYPLYAADAVELTDPFFQMYVNQLPAAKEAARQRWNAGGAYFPETTPFDGPVDLPEDVALEYQQVISGEKSHTELSDRAKALGQFDGHLRVLQNLRINGHSWISHVASSGSELAAQAWWRYRYTGDADFLRTDAYPLLKETVEFYRSLAKKGDDGLYHLEGLNQHEDFWGVHDGIVDLAAIRGTAPLAIHAAEILGVDASLRTEWQEFLDNLAPYPMGRDPRSKALSGGVLADDVWSVGHLGNVDGQHNSVDVWQFPIFPFEDWTLETRSPTTDAMVQKMIDLLPRMTSVLGGGSLNTAIRSPIAMVRAGRGEQLPAILEKYYAAFSPLPNGMSLFEGPAAQSIEHAGNYSMAVQEGLLQSLAPHPGGQEIISVFPAWPEQWDAEFRLLARGGFLVASRRTSGEVEFIEIESRLGETCWLRNPWEGPCRIQEIDGPSWQLAGEIVHFDTAPGRRYVVSPVPEPSGVVLTGGTVLCLMGYYGRLGAKALSEWGNMPRFRSGNARPPSCSLEEVRMAE